MEIEYIPIFLEYSKDIDTSGAWMHNDELINTKVMPLAYTSDRGVLRLMVSDIDKAASIIMEKGFTVRQSSGVAEVAPYRLNGLRDVLTALAEHKVDVELTGIIPGIYQG